jgi:hypothetical protein
MLIAIHLLIKNRVIRYNNLFLFLLIFFCLIRGSLVAQNETIQGVSYGEIEECQVLYKQGFNEQAKNCLYEVLFNTKSESNSESYIYGSILLIEILRKDNELEDAIDYCIRALDEAKNANSVLQKGISLSYIHILHDFNLHRQIKEFVQNWLPNNIPNIDQEPEIQYELGVAELKLKDNIEGVKTLEKLNNHFLDKEFFDLKQTLGFVTELSYAYLSIGNLQKAEELINQCLSDFQIMIPEHLKINFLSILGDIYSRKMLYNRSKDYYSQCISLANKYGFIEVSLVNQIQLARIQFLDNELEKSKSTLNSIIAQAVKNNNTFILALCYSIISKIDQQNGVIEQAILNGHLAYEYSLKQNNFHLKLELCDWLIELHEIDGNTRELIQLRNSKEKIQELNNMTTNESRIKEAELIIKLNNREKSIREQISKEKYTALQYQQKLEKTNQERITSELNLRQELLVKNQQIAKEKLEYDLSIIQAAYSKQQQDIRITDLQREKAIESLRLKELGMAHLQRKNDIEILKKEHVQLENENLIRENEIQHQRSQRFWIIGFVLFLGFSFVLSLFFVRRIKSQNKTIKHQMLKVNGINSELETRNFEILAGMEFGSKFQQTIFPEKSYLKSEEHRFFIIHKPLEIVSGDIPFVVNHEKFRYFAAVDCVGHGVAASMLSIMTHFHLSSIIRNEGILDCDLILYRLDELLQRSDTSKSNESVGSSLRNLIGLDIALVRLSDESDEIQFSGANLPIIISNNTKVEIIQGSKYSIGELQEEQARTFELITFKRNEYSEIFLFSDGFYHQLGGDNKRKKIGKVGLLNLIKSLNSVDFINKRGFIEDYFNNWKADLPQTDDMIFIGIKV